MMRQSLERRRAIKGMHREGDHYFTSRACVLLCAFQSPAHTRMKTLYFTRTLITMFCPYHHPPDLSSAAAALAQLHPFYLCDYVIILLFLS